MFKIYDGRDKFYQWDIDRKLILEDKSIVEVHFCNRTEDCALKCEAYELDGLWVADVPNVLLQTDWRIRVYAYDGQATLHEARYDVVARSKPEDYVYTEEELKSWEELEVRIDQIEENGVSDETVANAVEKYLDENGIQVDMSNYYTKTETEGAIEDAIAAIPEPDLSDYAKKSEIPSTSGLATEKYVDDAIADIDIPEVDLTDYATKKYVGEEIAKAQLAGGDVDLTGYATEKYVDDAIAAIEHPTTDLSNYYNKQEVDAKIPDTSGFALKSEIPSLDGYAKTTDIPDVSNFITEVPAEYVTETELEEAIAAIDVPEVDMSDYYSKEEIDNLLANLPTGDVPSGEEVEY